MKRNLFKERLEYYLTSESIPYAVLINGKWGSGKTHFLQNELKKHTKKKIVYASVNGISSIHQLNQIIINSKLLGSKSLNKKVKYVKFGGSILINYLQNKLKGKGDLEEISADLLSIISLGKKDLLVIDDIERIKKPLKFSELLGYVSRNFLEQDAIKVILVANEKELIEQGDSSKYSQIKEKTIWQTLQFNLDYKSIFENIANNFSNINKHLLSRKDWMIDKFEKYEIENLRTVLFYFQVLSEVEKKSYTAIFDHKLSDSILNSIMVQCNEYKLGKISGTIKNDQYIKQEIFSVYIDKMSGIFIDELYSEPLSKEDKTEEERDIEKEQTKYFSNKYLKFEDHKYNFFKSIYDFVVTGYFDSTVFNKEVSNISKSLAEKPKCKIVLENAVQVTSLEQEEFIAIWTEVLECTKDGLYGISDLMTIGTIYTTYSELVDFPFTKEELFKLLSEKMKTAEYKKYNTDNNYIYFSTGLEKKSEIFKSLRVKFDHRNQEINRNQNNSNTNIIIERIKTLDRNIESSEFASFFQFLSESQIDDLVKFVIASNKNTSYLYDLLYKSKNEFRQLFPYNKEMTTPTFDNVNKLLGKLKKIVTPRTTQAMNIEYMIAFINQMTDYG